MAALLDEIGGHQVDDNLLGRQRQAQRMDCRAHALARFGHRLVRQATMVKAGSPGAICACTSTSVVSTPSKATVLTCATIFYDGFLFLINPANQPVGSSSISIKNNLFHIVPYIAH